MLQQTNRLQKICWHHLIGLVVISVMMIPLMLFQKNICSDISFHCHSMNAPQIKWNSVLFFIGMPQLANQTQKCDFLKNLVQKDPNTTTSCNCSSEVPLSESSPPIAITQVQNLQYISGGIPHSPVMAAPIQQPMSKPTFQDASSTFQSIELSTVVLIA